MTPRSTRTALATAAAAALLLASPVVALAQQDLDDPASWEAHWSEDGSFVDVDCTIDTTGYDSFTITAAPPTGHEWFLAAFLNDEGMRTEHGMPAVGEELFLYDENVPGMQATAHIDTVVLCSADASSRGFTETEGEPGPVVETDVPAPSGPTATTLVLGLGALAALGLGAFLVGRRHSRS